ncbi:MAG: hypothetical protein ABI200_03045 [Gaiellales bacterium]
MQLSSNAPTTQAELVAALELIANGTGDDKVRYIAERDPDWFVDHVLQWDVDYVNRDEPTTPTRTIDRELLDRSIAKLALQKRATFALRQVS